MADLFEAIFAASGRQTSPGGAVRVPIIPSQLNSAYLSGKGMRPTGRLAMAIDRFSKSPFSFSTKFACNMRRQAL